MALVSQKEKEATTVVSARAPVCLCFIFTSSRQATVVSRLKWNMLRLFHRHGYTVARSRASVYNRTFHWVSTIVAATKTASTH